MALSNDDTLGVASTMVALGEPVGSAPTLADAAHDHDAPAATTAAAEARYLPQGVLGEGGMGVVERVFDADLMRELAVKRLRRALRADPGMQRQFLWEARVGAWLDHPNIVPVHDLGLTSDGGIFFTMKLVQGISLEQALEGLRARDPAMEARLPMPRRLRVFLEVARAIHFAHARGVVHRDLKPANVMLGDHGEVYVTDWGIAASTPEGRLAQVAPELRGRVTGTPQYMAPEQAHGHDPGERSDVYSLGGLLYELVALRPPVEGDTLPELLDRVRGGDRRPLAEVAPGASPSLCAVVERAMAYDPADRYPSAKELAEDVERVLDGGTPEAEHASLLTRAARAYVSPDKGLARIRLADVDMMVAGGTLAGIAIGLWVASLVPGWTAWPVLAAAALVGLPPTHKWWKARTEKDGP